MVRTRTTLTGMTWMDYVRDATRGDSFPGDVAKRIGADRSTVYRWEHAGAVPSPEKVIAFAHAYNVSPVEALVAAGHLAEEDAKVKIEKSDPRRLSNAALIDEVVRRLDAAGDDEDEVDDELDSVGTGGKKVTEYRKARKN